MTKEISLILVNSSYLNILQIFDSHNNKIIDTYINTTYTFKAKLNEVYRIKIISSSNTLITSIYTSLKYNGPYILNLENNQLSHKIFINLTDQNYQGLKIMKGEIKIG